MKAEDLKIEVIQPPNKGGQHVGIPMGSVKVTHVPTGIYAVCGCERSQSRCKRVAAAMVEYGLAELEWRDE